MVSHRGNASQYKLLFHLSDAKTFWKMYSLTEFSRKSYLCCGRYKKLIFFKCDSLAYSTYTWETLEQIW